MRLPFIGDPLGSGINTFVKKMQAHNSARAVTSGLTGGSKGPVIPAGPPKDPTKGGSPTDRDINKEKKYSANNYHPLDVVLDYGIGIYCFDVEGNQYFDFLSAYSAVNQGHRHPKIVEAAESQLGKITLTSRAFYNSVYPIYAEYITNYFKFDKVLPMNTGAEGVETAIKISKKWGYQKKGVARGEALVISCKGCFHGRTSACISLSNDPSARDEYEPFLPGILHIDYNDVSQLEAALKEHGNKVVAFIVEPIQGEAGIIVPGDGYLAKCKKLCEEYNVLFVADEIQTGLGRTGKLLACDWENVRPDILILGKALGGGIATISAVLADDHIMECITPGTHGSTFGGNPFASKVGIASLEVIKNEKLAENSEKMGNIFLSQMSDLKSKFPFIKDVRGRGLLDAVEIDNSEKAPAAWDICVRLKDAGILAKPTHEHTIRFAPPLTIKEDEMMIALQRIGNVLTTF